jgi:hypothetical protein
MKTVYRLRMNFWKQRAEHLVTLMLTHLSHQTRVLREFYDVSFQERLRA